MLQMSRYRDRNPREPLETGVTKIIGALQTFVLGRIGVCKGIEAGNGSWGSYHRAGEHRAVGLLSTSAAIDQQYRVPLPDVLHVRDRIISAVVCSPNDHPKLIH